MTTQSERAIALVAQCGMARARDFQAIGITSSTVRGLVADGVLLRLGRGLYQVAGRAGEDAGHDLAEAARIVPSGVISLLSALRYHGLTTQLPRAVWMMIPQKSRTPVRRGPVIEFVRAAGAVLTEGVERVVIEGVDVPITSVAKTVADCFKHRRHVGEDVAIESLRDALRLQVTNVSDLLHYADIDRVASRVRICLAVMQS